jgi:DNA-binding XRE family transcriptional regulator
MDVGLRMGQSGEMGATEVNERLRDLVETRRKELGYSPTTLAAATGLSPQGLAPIRRGVVKAYQERLTRPLCVVFGWSPDSIERIIAGLDPIDVSAVEDEGLRATVRKHEERIDQLERLVQGMGERLLALTERATLPDVDDEMRPDESRTAQ